MNKIIISGGRDYIGTMSDAYLIAKMVIKYRITEIVEGGQRSYDKKIGYYGADYFANKIGKDLGLKITTMDADWDDLSEPCFIKYNSYNKPYNALAGDKRNEKMAIYVKRSDEDGGCILLPGGKGTESMRKQAKKYGLKILYDAKDHER